MIKKLNIIFILLSIILFTSACSSKEDKELLEPVKTAEVLRQEANTLIAQNLYQEAIEVLKVLSNQYPFSQIGKDAAYDLIILSYNTLNYAEAVVAAELFLKDMPDHQKAPHVAYILAQSYYEQIYSINRDQEHTYNAKKYFENLIKKYPDSTYALIAQNRLLAINNNIAGKHLDVARYYINKSLYYSAIKRLRIITTKYQKTQQIQEALARLVQAYLNISQPKKAKKILYILGKNYPGNKWYKYAYDMYNENINSKN